MGPTKSISHFSKDLSAVIEKQREIIYATGISNKLTYVAMFVVVFRVCEERGPPNPYAW
jgi:hypothetical protein